MLFEWVSFWVLGPGKWISPSKRPTAGISKHKDFGFHMEFIYDVIVSIANERDEMATTLANKKMDELRKLAKIKGIKTGRKKQDIINALIASSCSGLKFVSVQCSSESTVVSYCYLNEYQCTSQKKTHKASETHVIPNWKLKSWGHQHLGNDVETFNAEDPETSCLSCTLDTIEWTSRTQVVTLSIWRFTTQHIL